MADSNATATAVVSSRDPKSGRTLEEFIQRFVMFLRALGCTAMPEVYEIPNAGFSGVIKQPTMLRFAKGDGSGRFLELCADVLWQGSDLYRDDEAAGVLQFCLGLPEPSPEVRPGATLKLKWRQFVDPPNPPVVEDPDVYGPVAMEAIKDNYPNAVFDDTAHYYTWKPASRYQTPGITISRPAAALGLAGDVPVHLVLIPTPWKPGYRTPFGGAQSSSALVWKVI